MYSRTHAIYMYIMHYTQKRERKGQEMKIKVIVINRERSMECAINNEQLTNAIFETFFDVPSYK